ncbi:hypothetical protein LTS18_009140 [Coniosporium uncinatum]|uniref:Uncharacterized protein n=1 Tax=Coniosporium uncinatum TaxID=93489 RepID=A0ACC3DWM5_9PEZI|nr:hypothetical protein LTS18_009140 [Coniosporium uncinatum]
MRPEERDATADSHPARDETLEQELEDAGLEAWIRHRQKPEQRLLVQTARAERAAKAAQEAAERQRFREATSLERAEKRKAKKEKRLAERMKAVKEAESIRGANNETAEDHQIQVDAAEKARVEQVRQAQLAVDYDDFRTWTKHIETFLRLESKTFPEPPHWPCNKPACRKSRPLEACRHSIIRLFSAGWECDKKREEGKPGGFRAWLEEHRSMWSPLAMVREDNTDAYRRKVDYLYQVAEELAKRQA